MRGTPKSLATCTSFIETALCPSGRRGATSCVLTMLFVAAVLVGADGLASRALAANSGTSSFPKTEGGMFGKTTKLDKSLPLYLQADQLVYDTKGSRVIARGNVEIFYNNNVLTADEVIYDRSAETLRAAGNVEVKDQNGNIVRADQYDMTADFRDGFVQSLSVVAQDNSRITAERGERREGNVTEFTGATFTACKSDGNNPPLWCVGAKKIIHDQAAGTITYQDAEFKFLGLTVGYVPYFEGPDPTVKRKSGFLMPTYGNSEELGFFSELPYYFALAPNYDFTFHPRFMTEQGILWQGDWRHRVANGEYSINLAGIDQDADNLPALTANRNGLSGFQGSIETHGNFSLGSWWSAGWNAVLETDDYFRRFYKLDSVLLTDRVNDIWLQGLSDRNYFGAKLYQFRGQLSTDTENSESVVHPVIDHNYIFSDPVFGGELSWQSNALSLSRSDSFIPSAQDEGMNRVVTELKWRRRLTDAIGITYTPFAELRGDVYQLNNYFDPQTNLTVEENTVVRGLATGGATVSYPWVAHTGANSHVIEPIGQIIAHNGSVDQSGLPNEDAKSLVFDDTNLFESSKFSGYDRLETGVRTNYGIQYTFKSPTGHARFLVGESYHIAGTNAYANPGTVLVRDPVTNALVPTPLFSSTNGLATDRSDIVVGAYLAPMDAIRIISQSRFAEDTFELRREDLTGQLLYGPLFTQATYTFASEVPETSIGGAATNQQDVIGLVGLKLTDRWTLTAAMRYDLDEDRMLTDSIKLAYLDECFMLSATYAETFIEDRAQGIVPDRTVMLRFEFKHLGGFNYQTNVVNTLGGEDASVVNTTAR